MCLPCVNVLNFIIIMCLLCTDLAGVQQFYVITIGSSSCVESNDRDVFGHEKSLDFLIVDRRIIFVQINTEPGLPVIQNPFPSDHNFAAPLSKVVIIILESH